MKPTLLHRRVCRAALLVCMAAPAQTSGLQGEFQRAVAAQQQGETRSAISIYRGLLRAHPEALPVRVNLGGLLVESGALEEAIGLYRAGLRLTPNDKELHKGLAFALGRRGTPADLRLATAELKPLHEREPADEQTSMLLADAYVRQSRYTDALPLLLPLEQAHPTDLDIAVLTGTALVRTGRLSEGVQHLDAVATAQHNAYAYELAGEARLDMQQFDVAKADAELALQADAHVPGGQTLLGRSLEHLGDYAAAEEVLRKCVVSDANDFEAQFYLGALLLFKRELLEAEEHLRKAVVLNPASAEARYKLALVESSQGHTDAALRDLQTVTTQRPEWLEPHSRLLALLYRVGRKEEAQREQAIVERLHTNQKTATPQQSLP